MTTRGTTAVGELDQQVEATGPVQLWLVGRSISEDGKEWHCVGVFDSREKAEAACAEWEDCVCPLIMNEKLPCTPWPNGYYPIAGQEYPGND